MWSMCIFLQRFALSRSQPITINTFIVYKRPRRNGLSGRSTTVRMRDFVLCFMKKKHNALGRISHVLVEINNNNERSNMPDAYRLTKKKQYGNAIQLLNWFWFDFSSTYKTMNQNAFDDYSEAILVVSANQSLYSPSPGSWPNLSPTSNRTLTQGRKFVISAREFSEFRRRKKLENNIPNDTLKFCVSPVVLVNVVMWRRINCRRIRALRSYDCAYKTAKNHTKIINARNSSRV